MSVLFISHSSEDRKACLALKKALESKGHESLFLDFDEKGIASGDSWERTLYRELRRCRAVLALCSDNYLGSMWCFAEVALARMLGKDIFTLQVDPLDEHANLPSILTERQFVDLRSNPEEGYRRLWRGFKLKGIVPAQHREWRPTDAPFPGLRSFDEEDAPVFFGREGKVLEGVELLNRVRRQGFPRVVMVLGASGSGKSSVTRAGILPQLRRDDRQWRVVGPFRPGLDPARELAAAFAVAFEQAGLMKSWEEVYARLVPPSGHPEDGNQGVDPQAQARSLETLQSLESDLGTADPRVAALLRRLKNLVGSPRKPISGRSKVAGSIEANPIAALANELRLAGGAREAGIVLVIDQFEELLGHDENPGGDHPADRFLSLLRGAVKTADNPPFVLGTMRSDYLGLFQRCRYFPRGVGFEGLSVEPMTRDDMRQVIIRPAELAGIDRLDDDLVNLLLDHTGPDALPLLAFTLRAMWDRYGRDMDIRGYRELGELKGAIATVAEKSFADALKLGAERVLRDAFLSLARPTEEGAGWARQPARWTDLKEGSRSLLEPFLRNRLLAERGDGVEVVHEALFRSWKKLQSWLSANSEALYLLREIHIDAVKWEQATGARDKEPYLWRRGRLARAVELRDSGVLRLKELDQRFVGESERAEREKIEAKEAAQRRELRRTRLFAAVMGLALVVMLWGYQKILHEARLTLSIQLAAQSSQLLDSQLDRAMLLALAAGRVANTVEARRSLLTAVQHNPRLWRFIRGSRRPAESTALDSDGRMLAVAVGQTTDGAGDGAVWLWDLETGTALDSVSLPLPGIKNPVVDFSADGRWLAAGGTTPQNAGRVSLWELGAGSPFLERPVPSGWQQQDPESPTPVDDMAFCGQGEQTLLARVGNTKVAIWKPGDASEPQTFKIREFSRSIAINPDCTCVAVGHAADGGIEFLDLSNGQPGRSGCPAGPFPPPDYDGVLSLAFSPEGDVLAAGREDNGAIDLWKLRDGSRRTLNGPGTRVESVAFRPDGTLASAASDGTTVLWDLTATLPIADPLTGQSHPVLGIAFSGDGKLLASGYADGTTVLWKLDRKQRLARALPWSDKDPAHQGEVDSVAFSPVGQKLASAGKDRAVRIWDLGSGQGETLPGTSGRAPRKVVFSADGLNLASGSSAGEIKLWRPGSDIPVKVWNTQGSQGVRDLVFGPDGTLAAAVEQDEGSKIAGEVFLWDVSVNPPRASQLGKASGVVWSLLNRDLGETLVAGTRTGQVLLWQKQTGWLLLLDTPNQQPVTLAQSPDETLLAGAVRDSKDNLYLWDMPGGTLISELPGHESEVLSVAFDGVAPDTASRTLFSADSQGNLIAWDLEEGAYKEIGRLLRGHEQGKPINGLAVSPGPPPKILVSAADDGDVITWRLDWRKVACNVARRDLRDDEWEIYVRGGRERPDLCIDAGRRTPEGKNQRRTSNEWTANNEP